MVDSSRCFFSNTTFALQLASKTNLVRDDIFEPDSIENFQCELTTPGVIDANEFLCQGEVPDGNFIGSTELITDLRRSRFEVQLFQGRPLCFEPERNIRIQVDGRTLRNVDCVCTPSADNCVVNIDDDKKFNLIPLIEHFLECVQPTASPTNFPTSNPTLAPTLFPTESPTQFPTLSPTANPTLFPTVSPTRNPTEAPTSNPTKLPTISPTSNPTINPTLNPTSSPTESPTDNPTANPTENPTSNPTTNPTLNPTSSPTESPTDNPTANPTENPTQLPTVSPTINPTSSPSENPTLLPTTSPTLNPTESPTIEITFLDSASFIPVTSFVGGLFLLIAFVVVVALLRKQPTRRRKKKHYLDADANVNESLPNIVKVNAFEGDEPAVLDKSYVLGEDILNAFKSGMTEDDESRQVKVQKMMPEIERAKMNTNINNAMSILTFDSFQSSREESSEFDERVFGKILQYLESKIIKTARNSYSHRDLAIFDNESTPQISLRIHLSRMVFGLDNWYGANNNSGVGLRCLLLSLLYLERLSKSIQGFRVNKWNVDKLLATLMLTAAKLTEEEIIINSYWSNVCGYPTAHIDELEKKLCFDYALNLSVDVKRLHHLVRIFSESEDEERSLMHYI